MFDFRTDSSLDLVRFYIKAADGGSGNDPFWIDDIYLESVSSSTPNLANPVPEPQAIVCLGVGAACLAWVFRRRGRHA